MNERIRELTEQAAEYAAQNATGDWEVGPDYQDIFNKKFAQLIVQECIQTIQNESMNSNDEWEYGLRIAQGAIQTHFGVEE